MYLRNLVKEVIVFGKGWERVCVERWGILGGGGSVVVGRGIRVDKGDEGGGRRGWLELGVETEQGKDKRMIVRKSPMAMIDEEGLNAVLDGGRGLKEIIEKRSSEDLLHRWEEWRARTR